MPETKPGHLAWTIAFLRVLAAWMIVKLAAILPATLAGWFSLPAYSQSAHVNVSAVLIPQALNIVAQLAVAIWVWHGGAERIAGMVWRDTQPDVVAFAVTPADLQRAAFAALGIYIIIDAIPALAGLTSGISATRSVFGNEVRYSREMIGRAVGVVAQIIAGACLLVGARGLAHALASLQDGISRMRNER